MTNHRYLPPSCGVSRRTVIASLAGFAAGAVLAPGASGAPLLTRPIRTSGETIPAVGLGTWITFNVGNDRRLRDERARVLAAFFEQGGGLIDSSPMYGSSEAVVGDGLRRLSHPRGLFAATKVWTPFTDRGIDQMAQSRRLWGVDRFYLMQVHNLVNWEGHLPALLEDKRAGRIRHVGITTSHGSRHDEMVRVMRSQPIDAVQFSYNILDRDAERELLPLAADRGLAVIVNRPFRTGQLFERFGRHPLPDFALELGCLTWSQFLLKFVISHPAVTCAIPATSRRDHLLENMAVLTGGLPDAAMRARMVRHVESL